MDDPLFPSLLLILAFLSLHAMAISPYDWRSYTAFHS